MDVPPSIGNQRLNRVNNFNHYKFMKKNHLNRGDYQCHFKRLLLIMKLTIFLIFACLMSVSASIYSQSTKLKIDLNQVTILDVFKQIEAQTEFVFIYKNEAINQDKKVNVRVEGSTVEVILDEVFKEFNLKYEIIKKQIIVTPNREIPKSKPEKIIFEEQQQPKTTINGKVTDANGNPIPGATVFLKGTTLGTISDFEGNFSLSAPLDSRILVVSFVGYKPQEFTIDNKTSFAVTLEELTFGLDEVIAVGYGSQKKETLTGSVSSIRTEALLRSPNSSIANTLAGQITGLSSIQSSGQPGKEDPTIYIRGMGSLSGGASRPLILVDGVERGFFQMDPNEIESVTVLKDASATAVFGVRGANGVVLVKTRRGEEGDKAKISVKSSYGIQSPTRNLEMTDSYRYALITNERDKNDGKAMMTFNDYQLERFRLGDEPIMYPSADWLKTLTNDYSIQTQHNVTISGGTKNVRYFTSVGFLYQDGLMKQFEGLDYDNNYKYNRYNYRTNLDIDITNSTTLGLNIGGIIGDTQELAGVDVFWYSTVNWAVPMAGPAGLVDGKVIKSDQSTFPGVLLLNPLEILYGKGITRGVSNTANFDLSVNQNLDAITKGLSAEVKAAYNSSYSFNKTRGGNAETYYPFYKSSIYNPGMPVSDPAFDKTIIYRITGKQPQLNYSESSSKNRNWYLEASLRYNRSFGDHNIGSLVLYNQNKRYYPSQFPELPTAYVGLVGRQTYNYKSKYLAEFNVGYNGSENFAPGRRYGLFPAGSLGYVLTEEGFMKNLKTIDYLKIRISMGLVGNDNIGGNRYLYLPDSYNVDLPATVGDGGSAGFANGYNFGVNSPTATLGAKERRLGNPFVTWEKSLKQNLGFDIAFFKNQLQITADVFQEQRNDILINRGTIPGISGLTSNILPVVNMGKVNNRGYEIEVKWNQRLNKLRYWVTGNLSHAKNKIIFQDEVEPNEPYMWRTGNSVGDIFGYVSDGFYKTTDFDANGELVSGLPQLSLRVYPGDTKYKDLNNDGFITPDDQMRIGSSSVPKYTAGFNYGFEYNGFSLTMNWTGAAGRSILINDSFRIPFNNSSRALLKFQADGRWTPETAETARYPRISAVSFTNNYRISDLFVYDGSYLKLKNAALGYTFSKQPFLKRLGISTMEISLTGYNLLTFDYFKLTDPETSVDRYTEYPIVKIYNLGLNITF
jgi:TonB-linked SusC/RagA family outer membrane protein